MKTIGRRVRVRELWVVFSVSRVGSAYCKVPNRADGFQVLTFSEEEEDSRNF